MTQSNSTEYIAPEYASSAFNCMHCGAYSSQFWSRITTYGRIATPGPEINIPVPEYRGDITGDYVVCWCEHCRKISIWYKQKLVFPSTDSVEKPNPDLPESVKTDYLEAANIVSQSPRGASALLRLAIQKLCDSLVGGNDNLNKKIGKLVENGMDKKIQQALDIVRVVGNNAVHPGELDMEDNLGVAQRLFVLVNMIARRMITEPAEVDTMFSSLPESAKNSIQERDSKK